MRAFIFGPFFHSGASAGATAAVAAALLRFLPALAVATLLPAGSAQAQFPGEIHGRVVDARTGEPVAGARVEVDGAGPRVLSEGDGRFRLRGLDEGPIRLRATRHGYLAATAEVRVRNGAVAHWVLRMEADPVELAGIRVEGEAVAAGSAVVLGREEIRASGVRTLSELLEGVPGVVVVRRGPGGSASVQVRGGGGDQVLVLVDGLRINDPVTGSADLSLVPLADVERVEVLPGALGARFGPGALSGVVRVVTGGTSARAELSAHAGSLGERGGSAALAVPRAWARIEAGFDADRARGGFDFRLPPEVGGGEGRRTNADHAREGSHLALRAPLARGTAALRVRADRWDRGVPGRGFAPADSARQTEDRLRVGASWEAPLPGAMLRLRSGAERRSARFRDPAPPLGPPFDERTELRAGDLLAEVERAPEGRAVARLGGAVQLRTQRLDADALAGESALGRTDWSVRAHGESSSLPVPLSPVLGIAVAADGNRDGWFLSHDVTLRGAAGPARFHLAHRSAHSPPSPADQFFREGVGIAPNPDLRAERVRDELEAGAALVLAVPGGDLFLSGAAFRADLLDMIIWAPDFRFVWSPRNRDVRRRGGELRAELRHASGARLAGHWSRVAVTYTGEPGVPAVQVIYRPRDSGGVRGSIERSGWRAELGARYTGIRYPVPARLNSLDPFWTLDASLSSVLRTDRWEVRPLLRVDRLLDERDAFIFAVPEPGRTVRAELRLRRLP